MQTQRLAEGVHRGRCYNTYPRPDALDVDGTDLLRLSFRVDLESGVRGEQKNLERIHARDVRHHRHHRHDAAPESVHSRQASS